MKSKNYSLEHVNPGLHAGHGPSVRRSVSGLILFLTIGIMLAFTPGAWATEYRTAASGHWSHPGTWVGGQVAPYSIGIGDTVIIEHDVFYNLGKDMTIYGLLEVRGDLTTRTVLTVQSGRSTYIEGAAANFRLINAGFNNTGAPPSGNASLYNNYGNLYSFNSFIELARFMVNTGATSEYRNSCVSIGRDFTSKQSSEYIFNSTISLGLNTKGGFEFTAGVLSCKNARVEVLSKQDGFFKLNSGSVSGNLNAISVQTSGGSIIANSQVSGKVVLEKYCLNGGGLFNGGAFTVLGGANDCVAASSYFPCSSFTPGFTFNDGYVVLPENGSALIGLLPFLYDLGYILNPGNIDPTEVIDPAHGTLNYDIASTSFTYTPDPGYFGTDSFTYVICDDLPFFDICDTAVIHLIISPMNIQGVGQLVDTVLHDYAFNGAFGESWPDALADGWAGFQIGQVSDPSPMYQPNNDFLGLKFSDYNTLGSWIESPPIDFGELKSLNISFNADGYGSITVFIRDSLNQYQLEHVELPSGFGGINMVTIDISINNPWIFDPAFNPEINGKTTLLIEYTNEDGAEYGRMMNFEFNGEMGTIWTGDHSEDWFHEGDWTNGVPNRRKGGLVPAGRPRYPRIVGNAEANGLIVERDALVVIKPQGTLTTFDTVYMDGKYALCIYADSLGTGAFYPKKGFRGDATAYIEQWVEADMWHHISAPIDSGMSKTYLSLYLLPWIEATNNWGNYIVPLDVPLPVMKGFAAWSSSVYPPMGDTVVWFGGHINLGSYSIEVTNTGHTGNPAYDGWNLVGNPFTTSIHWDSLGWNKNAVESAMYLWDPRTQSYRTYMGNGIGVPLGTTGEIPHGQGFFVKAKSGAGSFGVNEQARMLPTQKLFKTAASLPAEAANMLYVGVEGQGYNDQVLVRMEEAASAAFDSGLDAYKLFGADASAPQLYLRGDASVVDPLVVSAIGGSDSVVRVPIFLKPGSGGNFVLSLDQTQTFAQNTEFYLEDLKLDTTLRLGNPAVYAFTAVNTDAEGRFILYIVPASLSGRVSYCNNPQQVFSGVEVLITDATGKSLKSTLSGGDGGFHVMGLADGQYGVHAGSIQEPWNGGNATDALNVCRYFLGLESFDPLLAAAADVDNSGYVNTADALMISRRFVGLVAGFPGGDWVSESRMVQISGAGNYATDLRVSCMGDVDGSFGTVGTKVGMIPVTAGLEVFQEMLYTDGLPLFAASSATLGAISLSLSLPDGLRVRQVSSSAGHGELLYHQEGSILTISWFSLQAFTVHSGTEVFRILFESGVTLPAAQGISVVQPSEVADAQGKAMPGFGFMIPALEETGQTVIRLYPNPGNGDLNMFLEGYPETELMIEVVDIRGAVMDRWVERTGASGHLVKRDLRHLAAGKYLLRVQDRSGQVSERSEVLIITR